MHPARGFQGLVEWRSPFLPPTRVSHVLFDFDGTLSLIRQGWPEVMLPMFAEFLPRLPGETDEQVRRLLFEDIMRLNGKQTIYQMIQLAERIRDRGGQPAEPLWYKHEYLRRLDLRIQHRIDGIQQGSLDPEQFLVHGSRALLERLAALGLPLYLASGTDEPFVKREADLLGIAHFFQGRIYGAKDEYKAFSKKMVIERILRENSIPGQQLLAFGDGYVEIQNTKETGGFAVAVASDEANNGSGRMDDWKRQRLLGVGADLVIPDFRDLEPLCALLFGPRSVASPIDVRDVCVLPLARRRSLSRIEDIVVDPGTPPPPADAGVQAAVSRCAEELRSARAREAAVIWIYGAHLLRNGAARLLETLMAGGWITHLATNGAGTIHDWEFAFQGRSTESVEANVATGTFGTWDETGRYIHLALLAGGLRNEGYGRALGRFIVEDGVTLPDPGSLETSLRQEPCHPLAPARAELLQAMRRHLLAAGRHHVPHPWKRLSPLAQAFLRNVPLTVHPGIGYDIISNHPMFNGAAIGRAAQRDFESFGGAVERLDGGVVLSIGSAIMGPQVFEKSLSCVNNLRLQQNRPIVASHSIHVIDLQDGGNWDWSKGEPPKTNPAYYLRFCKSFSRMGGTMHYVCSDNLAFVHRLCHALHVAGPVP
jgi:phosphoglycolate phosphatase-like HAD superfamily hydrolase